MSRASGKLGSALLLARNHSALIVNLHQATAGADVPFRGGVMRVLECSQHVPVGQPQKRMRMHISGHIGERRFDSRMQRVAHIEDKSAASIMIVGKKHSAGRHRVFRVMYVHGLLISSDGRHQMSVRPRSWIGIDHREKVIAPPFPPFGSTIGQANR